jgi:hypothetical protein
VKRRRYGLLALLLAGAALLAFLLAGPARDYIILPLAKYFWMAKGIYASFPQAEYWTFLLVAIFLMLGFVLLRADWGERDREERRQSFPGDVQQLAYWIARSRKGIFSRWHLARRLADLALEILESRGSNVKATRQLKGPGWNPPPPVQKYLETALRTSYADFAKRSASEPESSLDTDVNLVIEYLESLVESEHDHSHS